MELGPRHVDRPVAERSVRHDDQTARVREVRVLEQPEHLDDVVAQEQVVVARGSRRLSRVRSWSASCRLHLAVARAFGKVEEAHARVGAERRRPQLACRPGRRLRRRRARSTTRLLVERALDRVREQCGVAVRRDDDRRVGHAAPARRRSSASAATIAAPSAALDFGGGPPRRCSTNTRSSASSGSSPGVSIARPRARSRRSG